MRWLLLLSFFYSSFSFSQSVQTRPIQDLVFFPVYEFSAEVISQSTSQISSQLSAQLKELSIKEGEVLPAGKVIARLDCRDFEDQLALTKISRNELLANLHLAELQYERLKNLQNRSLTSDASRDEALARKQVLEAQLNSLELQQRIHKRNIERCTIKAPFKGVIVEKMIGVGSWLNPGLPIVSIKQLEQAEIEVRVPLAINNVKTLSNAVWLNTDDSTTGLRLLRQSKALDPQSKMLRVWYKAPEDLLLGQQGVVLVQESISYLPADVLVQRHKQVGVFVVENQVAKFKVIEAAQIGRAAKLPAGWQSLNIVVEGQLGLQDGDRIE